MVEKITLTQDLVGHIAELAMLDLTHEETIFYQQKLTDILEFVTLLQTANINEQAMASFKIPVLDSDTRERDDDQMSLDYQLPECSYRVPKIINV